MVLIDGLIVGAVVWALFRLFGYDIDRGVGGFIWGSILIFLGFMGAALLFGWFGGTVQGALIETAGVQVIILVLNFFFAPVQSRK